MRRSRLRIWCFHRSGLSCCCCLGLIPGPGTSTCLGSGQKNPNKQTKHLSHFPPLPCSPPGPAASPPADYFSLISWILPPSSIPPTAARGHLWGPKSGPILSCWWPPPRGHVPLKYFNEIFHLGSGLATSMSSIIFLRKGGAPLRQTNHAKANHDSNFQAKPNHTVSLLPQPLSTSLSSASGRRACPSRADSGSASFLGTPLLTFSCSLFHPRQASKRPSAQPCLVCGLLRSLVHWATSPRAHLWALTNSYPLACVPRACHASFLQAHWSWEVHCHCNRLNGGPPEDMPMILNLTIWPSLGWGSCRIIKWRSSRWDHPGLRWALNISRQNCNSKRYMHPFVHSSTVHNSQDMEKT